MMSKFHITTRSHRELRTVAMQKKEPATEQADVKTVSCPLVSPIVWVPRADSGPYPALRVKVFFFADSGSLDCMLQFPRG